jgi:hypothetical protein
MLSSRYFPDRRLFWLCTRRCRSVPPTIIVDIDRKDVPKRRKLSELIGSLYTLRLYADYRPSIEIDAADAREAVSMMNTVFDAF